MENSFLLILVIGLLSFADFPKSSIAADTLTYNQSVTDPETIISAGISGSLVSWKSSQDPAPGVFPLVQDFMEGPEQLNIKNGSKIYRTGAARYFDLFVEVYKHLGIMSTYVTWDDDLRDSTISRIVLDVSGQLKLQSWTGGIQGWYTFEASTCGRSDCGSFSICNKTAQMPCGCLQGFKSESKDSWAQGPHYMWEVDAKSCVRKTELSCSNSSLSKKDGFLPIKNADFPINPLKLDVRSSMECESASLSNCSWIAYAFDERSGLCF
ncbi:hypothetical protein Q3G72_019560 [Acer saccharum]|nr:hypothetical protein Q3G72_019560 [Acer saccharum]